MEAILEFLVWAGELGIKLGEAVPLDRRREASASGDPVFAAYGDAGLIPLGQSDEQLVRQYFGIDEAGLERERRALLKDARGAPRSGPAQGLSLCCPRCGGSDLVREEGWAQTMRVVDIDPGGAHICGAASAVGSDDAPAYFCGGCRMLLASGKGASTAVLAFCISDGSQSPPRPGDGAPSREGAGEDRPH